MENPDNNFIDEELPESTGKKGGLKNQKVRGKKGHQHTRDEVAEAMKEFLAKGGKINRIVSEYLEDV